METGSELGKKFTCRPKIKILLILKQILTTQTKKYFAREDVYE